MQIASKRLAASAKRSIVRIMTSIMTAMAHLLLHAVRDGHM